MGRKNEEIMTNNGGNVWIIQKLSVSAVGKKENREHREVNPIFYGLLYRYFFLARYFESRGIS